MNQLLCINEMSDGSVELEYANGSLFVTIFENEMVHISQIHGRNSVAIEQENIPAVYKSEIDKEKQEISSGNIRIKAWENQKLDIFYQGVLVLSDVERTGQETGIAEEDTELAKIFFKFDRKLAISRLWNNTADKIPELTINYIIKIVNQIGPDDERLNKAFELIDNESGTEDNFTKRKKFEPFHMLGSYKVFTADTYLDTTNLSEKDAFKKASSYIYAWIHSRYCEAFSDLPDTVDNYYRSVPGYTVNVEYNEDNMHFYECSTHIDSKIASRIWVSKASLVKNDNGIEFKVSNEYAEPKDRYRDNENVLFSRPNFYGEIADNIGICDVVRLKENVKYVSSDNYDEMCSLINNKDRKFPVIVFMAKDNSWIDKFDVNYFAYLVGYYAHIKMIDGDECCRRFIEEYGLDKERCEDSITVFYDTDNPKTSYKSDIIDTTFEVIKLEQKKYWNENGCRAYRRQLVAEIREKNIENTDL